MSQTLQILLIAEYVILGVVALFECRWGLAMYWLGACILTVGVVVGMK